MDCYDYNGAEFSRGYELGRQDERKKWTDMKVFNWQVTNPVEMGVPKDEEVLIYVEDEVFGIEYYEVRFAEYFGQEFDVAWTRIGDFDD